MLTPQELTGKIFEKALFGGYDMASVEEFIEAVAKDYTDLYKENAALKSKMKVLVDKVEEYRSTEDAMRMALLTAQKMAKEITDEAERKSINLVADAERSAHDKIEGYRAEVAAEGRKLDLAKEKTAEFVRDMRAMMEKHGAFLDELETMAPLPEEPAAPVVTAEDRQAEQAKKAEEIEKSVAQIIENAMKPEAEAPKKEEVSSDTKVYTFTEGESKKNRIEFADLKFGDEYDATK